MHRIVKAWVEPKDREVQLPVRPYYLMSDMDMRKGKKQRKNAAEKDMSVVTLSSQKLKAWQKLRIEGKIGNWTEAQRVEAPKINEGSAVAAAASISVSQTESFFLIIANTVMKMNCAIAGDSATG